MKIPDATVDFPFDFNYIPLKLQPNLWDEKQVLPYRAFRFVYLYVISFAAGAALIFFPIGLFTGTVIAPFVMWAICSVFGGAGIGLLGWWTFCREIKKAVAEDTSATSETHR